MIEVKIGLDGVVTPNKIVLGNKWENNDEYLSFSLPTNFAEYNKYLIGVMKQSTGNQTVVLPVTNDTCYISSKLTHLNGNWNLYLMCREGTVDLNGDTVDLGAQENEHVFISNVFTGTVNNSMITEDAVENVSMDTNLQIVYDELMTLKKNILDQINNNAGSGDKDEQNTVPIHGIDVRSFSALYKEIKTLGLSLDEDDVSMFLFALLSSEVETTFNGKFLELNVMKLYRAEYNPYIEEAIVSCDEFTLTLKAEGVIGYKPNTPGSSGDIDPAVLDSKLDVYQGEENAGKIFQVDNDGYVALVEGADAVMVDEVDLDSMLEEVYGNG